MNGDAEKETVSLTRNGDKERDRKTSPDECGSLAKKLGGSALALVFLVVVFLFADAREIKGCAFTPPATLRRTFNESAPFPSGSASTNKQDNFTQFSCAPWLKSPEQRRALLIGGSGWDGFYNGTYLTYSQKNTPQKKDIHRFAHSGENYLWAAMDWALRQNGFVVEVSDDGLEDYTPQELARYHRIFKNGVEWPASLDDHPGVLCRIRFLHFWGNFRPTPENPWDQRQTLVPYRDQYNTFLGYFAHGLVQKPARAYNPQRKKHGFLLGKDVAYYKKEHHALFRALIDDGFTLHTTCSDPVCRMKPLTRIKKGLKCDTTCGGLPEEVIIHGVMAPEEYGELMSQMAFVMGLGGPIVSPSPFVGWAHGAAWLNPFTGPPETQQAAKEALQEFPLARHHPDALPNSLQHHPVAMLGAPYVYNIDLSNASSVLQAANWAVEHRFSRYAPPDYTPEAMVARTCAIVADDAICACPNPTFGKKEYKLGKDLDGVDCHGNSNIQN